MTFTAYELFYLDSYDDEVHELVCDCCYDEDDLVFEDIAWHIDADYVIDHGIRVAVIVHDTDNDEVDIALMQPGAVGAPAWYTLEDAANAAAELQRVLVAHEDGTISVTQTQDPAYALRTGTPFTAEDLTTATAMMVGNSQDNAWYVTFCIEFQPNMKSDFAFPVAVFAFDPREGRLKAHALLEDNPFAPPTFNRAQKKMVLRKLTEIIDRVNNAPPIGSPGKPVSPFTNLGPQFRSEMLPSVEAVSTDHAIAQSMDYLERFIKEQAG